MQAERGFVSAYQRDQRETIASLSRHIAIAVGIVCLAAALIAYWLSPNRRPCLRDALDPRTRK